MHQPARHVHLCRRRQRQKSTRIPLGPVNARPAAVLREENQTLQKKIQRGKQMSTEKGWIGVDLDGTLAHYDKWRGMDHIGEPIAPMVDHVKRLLADGRDVRIFTARVCSGQEPSEVDKFLRAITHWTFKHIGRQLPVTSEKDWAMIMLYDDRCLSVERNTGKIIPLDALDRIAELEATNKRLLAAVELHCNDLLL